MTAQHVEDMLAGFLLDALDPSEAREVHAHVGTCAACTTALAEARDALAILPESLEPVEPPSHVKVSLLRAAASQTVSPFVPRLKGITAPSRTSRWPWLAAAAAATVAFGAIASSVVLLNRIDNQDEQLAAAKAALDAIARSDSTLHMESVYAGANIQAVIAVAGEEEPVSVLITGLPRTADGEAYRLWLFDDGEPSAGVALTPDADGVVYAQLDIDLTAYDAMELDAQAADDEAPGGDLVLGGSLR
jgi:anti-sigma factor RsiW